MVNSLLTFPDILVFFTLTFYNIQEASRSSNSLEYVFTEHEFTNDWGLAGVLLVDARSTNGILLIAALKGPGPGVVAAGGRRQGPQLSRLQVRRPWSGSVPQPG